MYHVHELGVVVGEMGRTEKKTELENERKYNFHGPDKMPEPSLDIGMGNGKRHWSSSHHAYDEWSWIHRIIWDIDSLQGKNHTPTKETCGVSVFLSTSVFSERSERESVVWRGEAMSVENGPGTCWWWWNDKSEIRTICVNSKLELYLSCSLACALVDDKLNRIHTQKTPILVM